MHTAIQELEKASLRSDIPNFRPGDTLEVHVRVVEGNQHVLVHCRSPGWLVREQHLSAGTLG